MVSLGRFFNVGKKMKNKLFFAIYTLVVFGLGALLSFILTTKSYMQDLNNLKTQTPQSINELATPAQPITVPVASQAVAIEQTIAQNQQNKTNFSTQNFNEQSAKAVLNAIPDIQLSAYVSRFMTQKDAELIGDKRQFANRAIEELYKQNDNQPLTGQVLLSTTPDFPQNSMNTNTLQKRQKLYAHLNTFGKVPLGTNVFIKWTNRSTGEVLLFEKKLISPNSDTNWVSYQPYDSWQTGSYDIRFYQFTSQLEPVAQLSYDVNQVVE